MKRIRKVVVALGFLALLGGSLTIGIAESAGAAVGPPTVTITSPIANANVRGIVTLTATATAASGDTLNAIGFFDNGAELTQSFNRPSCGGQTTCTINFNWDTTGMSGAYTVTAVGYAANGGSTTSQGVPIQISSPPPTVSITSPSSGSTVKGNVTISVTAATDPSQSDSMSSIGISVNGAEITPSYNRPSCGGQTTCTINYTWGTTGMSGSYSITATAHTRNNKSATSPPVSVTVVSPPPTVSLTSPTSGAGVRGTVQLKATASIDPSQVDTLSSIGFFANGQEITQSYSRPSCGGETTCTVTFSWNTRGLSGSYALVAEAFTNNNLQVKSAPVSVVMYRRTEILRSAIPRSRSGQRVTIGGRVVTSKGKAAAPRMKVTLVITPVLGKRTTITTTTKANGRFSFSYTPTRNFAYKVSVTGTSVFGASKWSGSDILG